MKQLICILLSLGLAGCASYEARQHAQMLETAVHDHQACVQQGLKFPDDRYIGCRLQMQDDRLHQDWLNLQLMRQSQQQPNNVPAPYTPREFYRPLDPDHFACALVTEDKRDYVLCDETDEPKKP
jgi:hypothetical protein